MELIFLAAFVGVIVSIILLVINIIRKKPKKKTLISLGICLVLFVIGIAITPSNNDGNAEAQANLENNEDVVAADSESVQEGIKENDEETKTDITSVIEKAIEEVVGTTNNMDSNSISELNVNDNFGTDEEGDKIILATLNASDNLTQNMIKGGILLDSVGVFKNLFEIDGVSEVALKWDFPLVDQYGNKELGTIVKITLDKEIADKINWENFNKDNLTNIAKVYWEHPALSK